MRTRIKNLGAIVRVTVPANEVRNFKRHWPCSELPDRSVSFTFDKSNGDLLDLFPRSLDGEAAAALADDAREAFFSASTQD